MTNEIVPQSENSENALTIQDSENLAAFGAVADKVVSQNVFANYRADLKHNTIRSHDADLDVFALYLQQGTGINITSDVLSSHPQAWAQITHGIVKTFVEWLISKGYALGTVNRRLATVRKYAGLAFEAGTIPAETMALIKTVKGFTGKRARNRDETRANNGVPTRVTDENGQPVKKIENVRIPSNVVKKLKTEHDMDNPQARRDRVLMSLLLDHAMRASEAATVTADSVNFEDETIRFYRIKTDTWQTDNLTPDSLAALQAYKDDMLSGDKPLIRGSKKNNELTDKGISARTVTRIVNKLGKQHGLDRLSAHDCRHSWATRAKKASTHPQDIMAGGGWKTMAMVIRYTDALEISNERVALDS